MNYRDFKSIVVEDIKADIVVSDICKRDAWCSESLDESVEMYNSILLELMDKHCPVISKEMKSEDKDKPWIDQELKSLTEAEESSRESLEARQGTERYLRQPQEQIYCHRATLDRKGFLTIVKPF